MKIGVSVIICCYNSAARLPETLKYISLQQSNIPWELIVVNNNSTDATSQIAINEWERIGVTIPFKVVDELTPGLAAARNKGITTSQYEYLIYCDDDNWLSPNYVKDVYELFEKDSSIGIVGGNGSPIIDVEPPFWFEKFIHGYAAYPQSDKSQFVSGVYGAGMAIRKQCFNAIRERKSESLLIGRKGNKLSAGEDSELCYQVGIVGYKIWYDQRLTFKHFIPKGRLEWEYLKKLHVGFSKSSIVLDLYKKVIKGEKVSHFFWIKQAFYFLGIYLKYWPKHYNVYKKGEGSIEEIHHENWKAQAKEYFRLNFKLKKYYESIKPIK